jgi:hypothetical protein
VGADGAGRLEVGGVVGAHDDRVVPSAQKRRRDEEERGGGARGDEDVAGAEPRAVARDELPQPLVPPVVAVLEDELVEMEAEGTQA